jgi:osmotically-inducible protein OsmY
VSKDDLQLDVADELLWDPKIDGAAIAASADDYGFVTLRGTVGSFREKREAANAALRVYGVTGVDNQLEVRVLDADRRDDADIRGAVLQALMLDSLVPSTVDATVSDGIVSLTGMANWQYERDEADFVAANILGVIAVEDEIELTVKGPSAGDVKQSIESAFRRDARLDADGVAVISHNGTVELSGVVSSWSEHDAALAAAWAAPGVTSVEDGLSVAY